MILLQKSKSTPARKSRYGYPVYQRRVRLKCRVEFRSSQWRLCLDTEIGSSTLRSNLHHDQLNRFSQHRAAAPESRYLISLKRGQLLDLRCILRRKLQKDLYHLNLLMQTPFEWSRDTSEVISRTPDHRSDDPMCCECRIGGLWFWNHLKLRRRSRRLRRRDLRLSLVPQNKLSGPHDCAPAHRGRMPLRSSGKRSLKMKARGRQ